MQKKSYQSCLLAGKYHRAYCGTLIKCIVLLRALRYWGTKCAQPAKFCELFQIPAISFCDIVFWHCLLERCCRDGTNGTFLANMNRRSLHSLLERIPAQAPDFGGYNEAGLLALHDTVTCCDEVFHELERKFQIACTWITMVEVPGNVVHFHGLEQAKWPLREEVMMSLLSRFYSLRQDLQLHLNLLDLVFKLYRENYSSE